MSRIILLPQTTIPAASTVAATAKSLRGDGLIVQAKFAYGAGGTTVKVFVQTSIDGGTTYFDVMNFAFATTAATKISAISTHIAPASQAFAPGDAALTDNTIIQGVLGDLIRVKYVVAGTYTGASHLTVTARSV